MPHLAHTRIHESRSSSQASSRAPSPPSGADKQTISFQKHQQILLVPGSEDLSASTPHFPEFPPKISLEDNFSQIHLVHLRDEDGYSSYDSSSLSSASSSSTSLPGQARSSSPATKMIAKSKVKVKKTTVGGNGPHSLNLHNAQERRAYFQYAKHRKEVFFDRHV